MPMSKTRAAKTPAVVEQKANAPAAATPAPAPQGNGNGDAQPRRSRILLIDDHPMVRERLGELINQESDLIVCGEADDAHSAMEAIGKTSPDLALVDISLKDTYGIE